jgi:hypothetical protein
VAAAGVRPGLGDGKGASVDDATDAAVAAAIGDGDKHRVTALEVWRGRQGLATRYHLSSTASRQRVHWGSEDGYTNARSANSRAPSDQVFQLHC